jgi:dipeptidyl aminopeptidase/acylaminoacyl peptidase
MVVLRRAICVSLGAFAVGLVVTVLAPSAVASFPGANGLIAYTHYSWGVPREQSLSVHTVSRSGSGDVELAPGSDPAWSADGTRIAFVQRGDIFTMQADGLDQRRLTDTGSSESDPSYSPNGRRIVFTRTVGGDRSEPRSSIVSVRSADGSDLRVLADARRNLGSTPGAERPEYAPNGKRIVFFAVMFGLSPPGIYTMRPNGSHKQLLRRLSYRNWILISLDYSPDGRHIVLQRRVDNWGIVGTEVMRSDGSHPKAVPCPDLDGVAYSPDGEQFVAGEDGSIHTFQAGIANTLGHCGIPATGGPGISFDPSWQPLPSG